MGKRKIISVNRILLILLFQFVYILPVLSCSTPVFRYALERWLAYSYIIEVIHDGKLDDSQQLALDYLKSSTKPGITANIKIIETTHDESLGNESEKLPVIKLFYPKEHRINEVVWQGELTEENAKNIVDSPARKNAVQNIENGDASVWFFLESGNKIEDDKAAKILESQLKRLSQELQLATSATNAAGFPLDINIINSGVSFSMVRVSRTNPAEEIFAKILLGTEPDLASYKVPMAFPVFGRGRALFALVGKGINSKQIELTCNTVIGWCSCTIKEDNPGADLLFMADWDKALGDSSWIQPEEIPEITGLTGFLSDEKEMEIVVESSDEKESLPVEINSKPEESAKKNSDIGLEETDPKTDTDEIEEISELESIRLSETQNETILMNVDSDKNSLNPLTRNILLVILVLVILVPAVSILLKRKVNK